MTVIIQTTVTTQMIKKNQLSKTLVKRIKLLENKQEILGKPKKKRRRNSEQKNVPKRGQGRSVWRPK